MRWVIVINVRGSIGYWPMNFPTWVAASDYAHSVKADHRPGVRAVHIIRLDTRN